MKIVVKKIFICFMVFIMLMSSSNWVAIAEYLEDELVNVGVEIKILAETDNTVKTGELQKVKIKNSYANPNDKDYAKCRIYLTDENGKPNGVAQLQGMVDNKISFDCENNEDLSVTVELKEEKQGDEVISKYLEYILPPGTSAEMELEFLVPDGISAKENTLVLTSEVTHDSVVHKNDKVTKSLTLKWTSEFNWKNLQKNSDIDSINVNSDGKLSRNITYSFSAEKEEYDYGNIWTESVVVKDTLTLPEGISLPNNLKSVGNTIFVGDDEVDGDIGGNDIDDGDDIADDNILYKILLPDSDFENYTVNKLVAEGNTISFEITITNPNYENGVLTSDFNPMSNFTAILNAQNLVISQDHIFQGTEKIQNKVEADYYSFEKKEKVTLESSKDIVIEKEIEDVVLRKTVDKEEAYEGDVINYTITIENKGRISVTREMVDTLPKEVKLTDDTKNKLIKDGYNVSEGTPITISKNITVSGNSTEIIEFPVTVNVDASNTIENNVKYGELNAKATTKLNKGDLKLEKKQIKRWINYNPNGYTYCSDNKSDPRFSILGEGDRIEYEITLTNNYNSEQEVTLIDELPELSGGPQYYSVLEKFYLAGIDNDSFFVNSNNHKDFIQYMISNGTKDGRAQKTIVLKIPPKTTLKQTYIVDIPKGEDYIKFLDVLRYNTGYATCNPNNNEVAEKERVYNKIYIQGTDISDKVYHTIEPRYYLQKGVVGRNSLDNLKVGVTFGNPCEKNLNNFYYPHNENFNDDEVITFYSYFINDSIYELDLNKIQFVDLLSDGLEFLGLHTLQYGPTGYQDEFIESKSQIFILSEISNSITTRANSCPLLFVYDGRGTGYVDSNSTYLKNQYEHFFESDKITVKANKSSSSVMFDVNGKLKPGQGFYVLYSCKVNSNIANENITNEIFCFYKNNQTGIPMRKSDAYDIDLFNQNVICNNDGECHTYSEAKDSNGIDRGNIPFDSLWSAVKLSPESPGEDIEKKYGNICIKKVDEAGNEINLKDQDVIFQILDENKEPLNFSEHKVTINNVYKNEYGEKYYYYENKGTVDTTSELHASSKLSIKNLPEGTYYIKEIKAPDNFEKSEELKEFKISENPEDAQESDFGLLQRLGKEIEFTNVYNGKKSLFIEKKDSKTKEFITEDEAEFSISLGKDENSELVRFVNLDEHDDDGNHYRLATEDDEESKTTTTLVTYKGKIKIEELEFLKEYYIREIKAPFGYKKYDSYKSVSLPTNNLTEKNDISQTVEFENEKNMNNITITKVDGEEQSITSDSAGFELYDSENNLVRFRKTENLENISNYEYTNQQEDSVDKIETLNGKIEIKNLPLGMYVLKETKAPDGYVIDKDGITLNIDSADEEYEFKVENGKNIGNLNIVKTDTDGKVIDSDNIIFELYDENDNLIKFEPSSATSDEGRIYNISDDSTKNVETRLQTYKGKIQIKNIPIGNYYLKEIVAPKGYMLIEDKVQVEVTPTSYAKPTVVNVQNADYKFGSEQYVSTSYQKIEEKDSPDNYGYGYNGKSVDYESGNFNYIVVDGKDDIVQYTLRVGNMSKKNFEKVCIINKLPDIGDTGSVNLDQPRDSEFTIKLAKDPNFKLYIYDFNGEKKLLNSEDYKIEFSDAIQFTNGDWDGKENPRWYDEPTENTNSFRVTFPEGFELYPSYGIEIEFDGNIQDNAEPGQIAWNSFGYRYYVGETMLTPEPPKVGVKIPIEPVLTKTMSDGSLGTYYFDIYEDGVVEPIVTIPVQAGTSEKLPIKRTINGETTGYLEGSKTYIIKERSSTQAKLISIKAKDREVSEDYYKFTYDKEVETNVEFTNAPLTDGKIILRKIDKDSKVSLPNAKFNVLDENNQILKFVKDDNTYTLKNDGNIQEVITDKDGKIVIEGLPFGTYKLKEVEAPQGYILDSETVYTVIINSEDYKLENNEPINIPEELDVENTKVQDVVQKVEATPIVEENIQTEVQNIQVVVESIKTGDQNVIIMFIILITSTLIGGFTVYKKKKNNI